MAALAVNTVREANTAAFAQHLAETPTYAWEMLQLQSSVLWLKLSKLSPQVRSDRN
jgi:ferric-chelate reductase